MGGFPLVKRRAQLQTLQVLLAMSLPSLIHIVIGHPCVKEISSACPQASGDQATACLLDPKRHKKPTMISVGCTDFVALNSACADEIKSYCDLHKFADDTMRCLTKWIVDKKMLADTFFSEECRKLYAWAAPRIHEAEKRLNAEAAKRPDPSRSVDPDADPDFDSDSQNSAGGEDDADPEDSSETDYDEEEAKKQLDFAKSAAEAPHMYLQMMEDRKEEDRQKEEVKRLERKRAAALERQQRAERKKVEKEQASVKQAEEDKVKSLEMTKQQKERRQTMILAGVALFFIVAVVGAISYSVIKASSGQSAKKTKNKDKKKR